MIRWFLRWWRRGLFDQWEAERRERHEAITKMVQDVKRAELRGKDSIQ
jgi:hypothetical protein